MGNGSCIISAAICIKVEHGRALACTSTNDWQEVDGLVNFFAPDQDPLGFLSAANNREFTLSITGNNRLFFTITGSYRETDTAVVKKKPRPCLFFLKT